MTNYIEEVERAFPSPPPPPTIRRKIRLDLEITYNQGEGFIARSGEYLVQAPTIEGLFAKLAGVVMLMPETR
jgi:hypothetical protein